MSLTPQRWIAAGKQRSPNPALAHDDEVLRDSARDALRGSITAIVIPAGDELLEVRGTWDECCQRPLERAQARLWLLLMMVAGGGFEPPTFGL